MKILEVEAEDADKAQFKLASELGVPTSELRFLAGNQKRFTFEALSCPAAIEIDITPDRMKAVWTRIYRPIGAKAPPLDVDFILKALEKKGVKSGIKTEVIKKELSEVAQPLKVNESVTLHVVVAEGLEASATKAGRPKLLIDTHRLEKGIPLFSKKGEVLARAANAEQGQDGYRVTGEVLQPPLEEQWHLNIGAGVEVVRTPTETLYVAKCFGQIHFDNGERLRVESKILDREDGMVASIEIQPKSFTGSAITADELVEFAKENQVTVGILSTREISEQLKHTRKWPAEIIIAKGQPAQDGRPGQIEFPYQQRASDRPIDVLKTKSKVVFPGETLAIIHPASEPVNGRTVFGEVVRGKHYQELPIYAGRNVNKERVDTNVVYKAAIYGRVVLEKERLSVENMIQISSDQMEASLDVFPQQQLSFQDVSTLLRDRDILFGIDKEEIEKGLVKIFQGGARIEKFVLARGKPARNGVDARLVFHFKLPEVKKSLFFSQKSESVIFAAEGDLLAEKFLPVYAEEGMTIFRELIEIEKRNEAKDVEINLGDLITEIERGKLGDEKDPARVEYRASQMGVVTYKKNTLDLKSTLVVDADEKEAQLSFLGKTDFKSAVTYESIAKLAEKEGIRVPLNKIEIEKALRQPRPEDGTLHSVVIARAIEVKNGANAQIQYFVEFNGKPIESFLFDKKAKEEAPVFCDCVRPLDLLAVKTPATAGEDGRSVYGRRIPATRGLDEAWRMGPGVQRSEDGLQLSSALVCPGFVMVEGGKITVRNTVKISKDRMQATISIYPSKNPRFQAREDKIYAMIAGGGVKYGVNRELIKENIRECFEEEKPLIDLAVAEGKKPTRGKSASFVFAMDTGETVGQIREDGSIDFKGRVVFQNVKKGQLLAVKHPAMPGEDGYDVLGATLPNMMGHDSELNAAEGVQRQGLEFRSSIDGILELQPKSIRVIPGLFIPEDVNFKTGNIHAGSSRVIIKGSVLPDFVVSSDKEILIEKAAEACTIKGKEDVRIRGGIIGREKGYVYAGRNLETLYIVAGSTVEVEGDITVGTEILNSNVRTAGFLHCSSGAGTIYGGEISVFKGLKAKTIGASGSETQTTIRLGDHFSMIREAEKRIEEEGIPKALGELEEKARALAKELADIYDRLPNASKKSHEEGLKLQEQYRVAFQKRKDVMHEMEQLHEKKLSILASVPVNKDVSLVVTDLIHPGVMISYKDVVWVLKEPLRGVEIKWNPATNNLVSRRI